MGGQRFIRLRTGDGRIRVGRVDGDRVEVLRADDPLDVLNAETPPQPAETIELLDRDTLDLPRPWRLLSPVVAPETWAAGVTYEDSRQARMAESQRQADIYALVYDAERPELFLKDAAGRRTVGPRGTIGVRSDASWTVPEPEVALVLGRGREPLALTIGNDVSSRDIEGENPLYLPQAKIYAGACALGPALLVPRDWSAPLTIELHIVDGEGATVFAGETSTAGMRRSFDELVAWLRRDNPVLPGTVLLTGTGLVPPDEFTLEPGHVVQITVPGIGTLTNPVGRAEGLVTTN